MQDKNQKEIPQTESEMSEDELDAISGGNGGLDKLGDQSQIDQMNMQQYMERKSKTFGMLSNAMKKMSSTGDSITKNLK